MLLVISFHTHTVFIAAMVTKRNNGAHTGAHDRNRTNRVSGNEGKVGKQSYKQVLN